MRFSCYDWNPKRFHPEFTGVASRYSEHKKERLAKQKQRKELQSDHIYTLNLDRSLDKAVENKTLELFKLHQAKQRHLDELKYKQLLNQERRQQIESLRERNLHRRLENKKNLDMAKSHLYSRNEHSRVKIKEDLSKLSNTHEKVMSRDLKSKYMKRREIQEQQLGGLLKVDNFYREKNEESLNLYLERIKEEDRIKNEEQKKIKRFEKELRIMNKTVSNKKDILNHIQAQIYKLKTNIKTLNSGSKIRRKTLKEDTDGSEVDPKSQNWKKSLKKLMNPEDYNDLI